MSYGEHGHMKIEIFSVNFESTNLIEEKESVILQTEVCPKLRIFYMCTFYYITLLNYSLVVRCLKGTDCGFVIFISIFICLRST